MSAEMLAFGQLHVRLGCNTVAERREVALKTLLTIISEQLFLNSGKTLKSSTFVDFIKSVSWTHIIITQPIHTLIGSFSNE